jgi:hypothetical protein
VVQWEVIPEVSASGGSSGAGLVLPMLKRGDYTNWAMVMEVNMQAASLWDAIEDVAISRREDKQAWWRCFSPRHRRCTDADQEGQRHGGVGGHPRSAPGHRSRARLSRVTAQN